MIYKNKKQLRVRIRAIVRSTLFKNQSKLKIIELIVFRAIELINSIERRQLLLEKSGVSKPRSRGRPNESKYRTILTAAIFRAWRVGNSQKPIVNKRIPGAIQRPFVEFTSRVYRLLYIFNTIDNIDHYRSLGRRLEKDRFEKSFK